MGIINTKDLKNQLDQATSNTSLSNLRYIITEKPKWKVFRKKEIKAIPNYTKGLRPLKGCPCGNDAPCKQKVTPNGVTLHYPQKRRRIKFGFKTGKTFTRPKMNKSLYNSNPIVSKMKVVRPKNLAAWRVDEIQYMNTPFCNRCDKTLLEEISHSGESGKSKSIEKASCFE